MTLLQKTKCAQCANQAVGVIFPMEFFPSETAFSDGKSVFAGNLFPSESFPSESDDSAKVWILA
jgi:hypothetical protein